MSKRPAELTPLEQNCFVKLAHRRKLASETVAYVWEDCHQWVTGLTKYFTATVKPFLAAWVAAPKGAAADAVLEPREFWGAQMRPSKLGVLAYFDTLILGVPVEGKAAHEDLPQANSEFFARVYGEDFGPAILEAYLSHGVWGLLVASTVAKRGNYGNQETVRRRAVDWLRQHGPPEALAQFALLEHVLARDNQYRQDLVDWFGIVIAGLDPQRYFGGTSAAAYFYRFAVLRHDEDDTNGTSYANCVFSLSDMLLPGTYKRGDTVLLRGVLFAHVHWRYLALKIAHGREVCPAAGSAVGEAPRAQA